MRPYNFYCLLPAISHCKKPIDALNGLFPAKAQASFNKDVVLTNLGALSAALDDEDGKGPLAPFVKAASSGTNNVTNAITCRLQV